MREEPTSLKMFDEKLELLLNTPEVMEHPETSIEQAEYDRNLSKCLKKNIKYVLFNGGNGSMDTQESL